VVTMLSNGSHEESNLLGMTEVIENTRNPSFEKTFFATYEKGDTPTYILIKILDEVYNQSYREMGQGIFDLRSILDEEGKKMTKKLNNGGIINLQAVETVSFERLNLKLSGSDFVNARGRGKKCIPFYQFARKDESNDDEWMTVYTSQRSNENSLDPNWSMETIDVFKLCNYNFNAPIQLSIYHYKSNGKHVLMGEVETSMNELVSSGKLADSSNLRLKKKGFQTGLISVNVASVS